MELTVKCSNCGREFKTDLAGESHIMRKLTVDPTIGRSDRRETRVVKCTYCGSQNRV